MRLRFLSILLLVTSVALVPACRSSAQSAQAHRGPTTAAVIPLATPKAAEITVEPLELLLPRRPIVVGFDVDDTLIFSAPAFNALQPEFDADVIRPKVYAALTPAQKLKYHEFWNRLNLEYDDRSVPKQIGKRLLDLHLARGDDVWIISKRQSIVPEPKVDVVTQRYERMFGVKLKHPVVQTQLKEKTPFIYARKMEYYYGDADGDITAAVAAGAVPIRVKRAADSYGRDAVHNGQLGEIVIADSER
jgi:acid phosphatase (class B)